LPKFVVFWTISTIQDEKSAAKFHYIKTVSGKVVAQSIAFRVVSIYWQWDDPFPLKSWLQVTYSLMKAASFDTFCLVAPQPQEIECMNRPNSCLLVRFSFSVLKYNTDKL